MLEQAVRPGDDAGVDDGAFEQVSELGRVERAAVIKANQQRLRMSTARPVSAGGYAAIQFVEKIQQECDP